MFIVPPPAIEILPGHNIRSIRRLGKRARRSKSLCCQKTVGSGNR